MKNARTPQEAAAEALAALLTDDGAIRLHVHEDGALVTLATTYYDPADNARTPQEAAAEALAALLTDDGAIRLHVDKDGALVTLATTYYDYADEEQPGRPVDDEEHATFPVTSTDAILYCLRVLADEHGAT